MARPMTCEQAREALRAYALRTLSDRQQVALHGHLHGCDACREAFDAERAHLAILDIPPGDSAPPGLAERTLARIREADAAHEPTRIAPNWISLGITAAVVFVLVAGLIPAITKSRESARRASTQGNMKQLGLVFKMYANESPGAQWPRLARLDGVWIPDLAALHGEFITDPGPLISEEHPDRRLLIRALRDAWEEPAPDIATVERLMGESYGYLGYSVDNEVEFEALRVARENGALPEDGSPLSGGSPTGMIPPLRDGVERFLITDINNPAASSSAQSTIPVLIEIASWKHKASVADYEGANVLYMDGHVAFVRLGTFPVVASVLDALSGIGADG
ncbi:MAG: zf-HC2 domain-containing protein [Gammaproteobacteria bacterium]|nr:zf-HC2 domain-containing protein [Gammaproteobacteria bacterium]